MYEESGTIKKRSVRQIQAQRRAEIIMSLSGMLTNLHRFRDIYCRSFYLKGILNVAIVATEKACEQFKDLPNLVENADRKTWHSMFNSD